MSNKTSSDYGTKMGMVVIGSIALSLSVVILACAVKVARWILGI